MRKNEKQQINQRVSLRPTAVRLKNNKNKKTNKLINMLAYSQLL
jgi:hypothetical protein